MKTLLNYYAPGTLTLSSRKASSKKLYDCFDTPVAADILFNKKKIYGGAIRKRKGFFLFQGTLQGKVIEENRKEIIEGITYKMENLFEFKDFNIDQVIMKEAKKLTKEKYRSDEWNVGRKKTEDRGQKAEKKLDTEIKREKGKKNAGTQN